MSNSYIMNVADADKRNNFRLDFTKSIYLSNNVSHCITNTPTQPNAIRHTCQVTLDISGNRLSMGLPELSRVSRQVWITPIGFCWQGLLQTTPVLEIMRYAVNSVSCSLALNTRYDREEIKHIFKAREYKYTLYYNRIPVHVLQIAWQW